VRAVKLVMAGVAAMGAITLVWRMAPEIQRYIKIEKM
jgi:hypothetical protein